MQTLNLNLEGKPVINRLDKHGSATILTVRGDRALVCFNNEPYSTQNILWLKEEYIERKYGPEAAKKVFP